MHERLGHHAWDIADDGACVLQFDEGLQPVNILV